MADICSQLSIEGRKHGLHGRVKASDYCATIRHVIYKCARELRRPDPHIVVSVMRIRAWRVCTDEAALLFGVVYHGGCTGHLSPKPSLLWLNVFKAVSYVAFVDC
jgi:hypothetical protein